MTYLDWIIVSVVAGCMFLFALRGFVRQTMGLLILTAAILGAWMYRETAGSLLEGRVELAWLREALGFVGLFFSVMIVGSLLTWAFVRLRSILGLSVVDRMLGVALGAAVGLLVSWAFLVALQQPFGEQAWWRESRTAPLVLDLGARVDERVDFQDLWRRLEQFVSQGGEAPSGAPPAPLRPGTEAGQGTE